MFKYSLLFVTLVVSLGLLNCGNNDKVKTGKLGNREFNEIRYTFHFNKPEDSIINPALYKPRGFKINGRIRAELYPEDTLFRFVNYFQSENNQPDSSIQIFRLLNSSDKVNSKVPSELFGCQLLGVYNLLQEDIPDNFYFYFYANENDGLFRVDHLYYPGNVNGAIFFQKDSIDPTIKYRNDVSRLLGTDQKFNPTDTMRMHFEIKNKGRVN